MFFLIIFCFSSRWFFDNFFELLYFEDFFEVVLSAIIPLGLIGLFGLLYPPGILFIASR